MRVITRDYDDGTRDYDDGTRDYDSITRSYRREREVIGEKESYNEKL